MTFRLLLCALFTFVLVGCETPYKKKDAEDKKPFRNQAGDQGFQAFTGRLRIAVAKRDHTTLASMMTGDFGYRWEAASPGESVFQYWDQHNLWPVLDGILRQNFAAHDNFMVAPPQVASDPDYTGYRAGMRIVNGSWKFAYFVPAEGVQ